MSALKKLNAQVEIQEVFKELLEIRGPRVAGLGNWKTGTCLAFDGYNTPVFPNGKVEVAVGYNAEVI